MVQRWLGQATMQHVMVGVEDRSLLCRDGWDRPPCSMGWWEWRIGLYGAEMARTGHHAACDGGSGG